MLWTQPTAHLGNFLYDWMHAFNHRNQGLDIVCLRTEHVEPWIPIFGPAAEALTIERSQVRWTDRREIGLFNEYGVAFDAGDLASFIEGFVLPSGVVAAQKLPDSLRLGERDVLVNVRRGDYFTNEANRRSYSFDTDDYLRVALAQARRTGGDIDRILVVSDGIQWCREHLSWLAQHCETLVWEDTGQPPDVHLAALANAPRLILTNSTFSYWGGYLSTWATNRPDWVVAPWFHRREDEGGAAWQLDPNWTIVKDIPSGWALP